MMIFFKERLAYLAVPKTGTSAVERALHRRASAVLRDPPGIKHTNARGYERRFRSMFERGDLRPIQTVAVMREPIDWLGSWYRYRQRPALSGHRNSTEGLSFDAFIEGYLADRQPAFAEVGSQGRFVTDENGDLLVNHLFQYEEFDPFIDFLQRRLGSDISLKTVNKSPHIALELSDSLRVALHETLSLDFQIHSALSDGPLSLG
ncbi:gamma-glutamyl kinase [Litoreibacter sp.]|nr:gamma-glutamyl kinase [Litoreibacter sp.]